MTTESRFVRISGFVVVALIIQACVVLAACPDVRDKRIKCETVPNGCVGTGSTCTNNRELVESKTQPLSSEKQEGTKVEVDTDSTVVCYTYHPCIWTTFTKVCKANNNITKEHDVNPQKTVPCETGD